MYKKWKAQKGTKVMMPVRIDINAYGMALDKRSAGGLSPAKFNKKKFERKEVNMMDEKKLPVYEAPKVITYIDEDILEELGPAQTGYVKDSAF